MFPIDFKGFSPNSPISHNEFLFSSHKSFLLVYSENLELLNFINLEEEIIKVNAFHQYCLVLCTNSLFKVSKDEKTKLSEIQRVEYFHCSDSFILVNQDVYDHSFEHLFSFPGPMSSFIPFRNGFYSDQHIYKFSTELEQEEFPTCSNIERFDDIFLLFLTKTDFEQQGDINSGSGTGKKALGNDLGGDKVVLYNSMHENVILEFSSCNFTCAGIQKDQLVVAINSILIFDLNSKVLVKKLDYMADVLLFTKNCFVCQDLREKAVHLFTREYVYKETVYSLKKSKGMLLIEKIKTESLLGGNEHGKGG